jgi:membrane-associated phospholipid phosphatase
MIRRIIFLTLIFLLNQLQVLGQNEKDTTKKSCLICTHNVHVNEAPYDHSFKRELPFIIASGVSLTSGILASVLNTAKPFSENELDDLDINEINKFDRDAVFNYSTDAAKLSDYIRSGVTILPIVFIAEHNTRKDIKSLVVMSLEVFSITYGLTSLTKNVVNRTRPFVYNPEVDVSIRTESGSRLSYFSGHTSHTAAATFFIAKVFSDYHPNMHSISKIGMWTFSAVLPAVTGYLRVEAGKHFPTDVISGYIVGASVGWLVPHLHKIKHGKEEGKVRLGISPYKDGLTMNLKLKL